MQENTVSTEQVKNEVVASTELFAREIKSVVNNTTITVGGMPMGAPNRVKKAAALVCAVGNYVVFQERLVRRAYERDANGNPIPDTANPGQMKMIELETPVKSLFALEAFPTKELALAAIADSVKQSVVSNAEVKAAIIGAKKEAGVELAAIYASAGVKSYAELLQLAL